MSEETISLDDLIDNIVDHLAETDHKYRAFIATKIGAEFTDDDDVLKGIKDELMNQRPSMICTLATDLLTPDYDYDGDSIVTVRRSEATPSSPGM